MQRLALVVLVLAGCTDEDVIEHTAGRACAEAATNRIDFAVDLDPWPLQCLLDAEATCTVTRMSYTRMTVSTELHGTPADFCTREVHRYTAHCSADLVANVTQRIEFGDLAMTLELPGDYAEPLCVQP